ncbi:hypothetical protein K2173_007371 [Erythroxylum novogranatense]|uniref:HTH La-type RNA-binding domain-containing protein n=1 Tax=Erythroxylum novogranatense TaxID=1862640 RepID=A0AAV8T7I7_9ROSI|nr:hypothetical protein K2173_007371 [Erythroxylum novogranatense]
MTATPSQDKQSPRASGVSCDSDAVNSPQKRRNLPSAWAQVVRGEQETTPTVSLSPSSSPPPSLSSLKPEPSSFSDCSSPSKTTSSSSAAPAGNSESSNGSNDNADKPKKLAWNRPSNGLNTEIRPVMGATSWPALSESTKPSPKSLQISLAESSAKTSSDVSPPDSQGPVIPNSPQKVVTINVKSNSAQSHMLPARQRSMRRGGNGGGGSNSLQSGFNHPPPPSPPPLPPPLFPLPPGGYHMVAALPDQSPREPPYRANHWEPRNVAAYVPQSSVVNDHRHSSRRNSTGPRGEGTYHNSFGGRRDHDRGRYGNARDGRVQPQRGPSRGFTGHPPNAATFAAPPHVPTFVNALPPSIYYVPAYPMDPLAVMPVFHQSPVPAVMMPGSDFNLQVMLVNQIEYYFSDANLVRDEFLKSNMDEQGWVPITLIADFNRVKRMTVDLQLILESLRTSTVLEVEEDKVRRRNDWMKWIPNQSTSDSSYDMLSTSLQKIAVDDVQNSTQDGTAAYSSPQSEDQSRR